MNGGTFGGDIDGLRRYANEIREIVKKIDGYNEEFSDQITRIEKNWVADSGDDRYSYIRNFKNILDKIPGYTNTAKEFASRLETHADTLERIMLARMKEMEKLNKLN